MTAMRISEKPQAAYPFFARIIFWAQRKKYGESLLPSRLWGRSPKLLYGLQVFYRALDRKSSPLEPALRALINVKISQINHCSFCVDIGSALLEKRGVSTEKVSVLEKFESSTQFSERERSAIAYAEAVTRYDVGVSDELFQRLLESFSQDEVIELTALIGFQNLSSKFNAALAVPPQGFCVRPPNSKEKDGA